MLQNLLKNIRDAVFNLIQIQAHGLQVTVTGLEPRTT